MDLQERMLAFTVPHEGLAMGRNGLMRTSGLRVCCFMSGVVIIEPVTSRGQIGNCRIEMPVSELSGLIAVLRDIAKPERRTRPLGTDVNFHEVVTYHCPDCGSFASQPAVVCPICRRGVTKRAAASFNQGGTGNP